MARLRILIIAEDKPSAVRLAARLRRQGYVTAVAHFGQKTVCQDRAPFPNLILLGPVPSAGKRSWWHALRAQSCIRDVPVIKFSRRRNYLAEPAELPELLKRIRAFENRLRGKPPLGGVIEHAEVSVDPVWHRAYVRSRAINPSPIGFQILACLLCRPEHVFTRGELLEVTTRARAATDGSIDQHIRKLRALLGEPGLIETVRGVGFRIRSPDDSAPHS